MVNVMIRTGVVLHNDTETQTSLEIFHRNKGSVTTTQTELFDNVCYVEFQIIFLKHARLKYNRYYHKMFPNTLTNVHSVTVGINKCSAADLTAVPSAASTHRRLCDLQL